MYSVFTYITKENLCILMNVYNSFKFHNEESLNFSNSNFLVVFFFVLFCFVFVFFFCVFLMQHFGNQTF